MFILYLLHLFRFQCPIILFVYISNNLEKLNKIKKNFVIFYKRITYLKIERDFNSLIIYFKNCSHLKNIFILQYNINLSINRI